MSYTTDFVNNRLYGADDINKVRTTIMTEGIIKKGETDCLVTILADGIHIDVGEALFNDGCRIEVTEAETIAHDGSDCYVYFDRNYYGEPKADKGDSLPENCIPLAKITSGTVEDLRNFATLKIPTMATNRYLSKELELDFRHGNPTHVVKSVTFEDRTDISYMTFEHTYSKYETKVFIDFVNGCAFGYNGDIDVHNHYNNLFFYDTGVFITYSKTGNTVTFDINCATGLDLGTAVLTAM